MAHREQAHHRTPVPDALMALPPPPSVPLALDYLRSCRDMPRTVMQAMGDLKQLLSAQSLSRLYRQFFPRKWLRSRASFRIRDDEGYSPREIEFLQLVERHLFPFDLDFMLDEAAEGGRTDVIEILPSARRWWTDIEEIDLGWRLLLMASGALSEDASLFVLNQIENLDPSLHEDMKQCILREGPGYSMAHLRRLCERESAPLSDLPLAFSMTLYDTGNPWLDVPGDDGTMPFEDMGWNEHDIEVLTETYQEAQQIEQRAAALISWLEFDVTSRMKYILALIEQASPSAE